MFGTNKQFSLERLAFSTRGAFLSIYEDIGDGQLYFSLCRSRKTILERPDLLRISTVSGGEEVPFIYECDEARLILRAKQGTVEFAFETPQLLRVRAKGVTLKVSYTAQMHDGGCVREHGEVEVGFTYAGKLLFAPVRGRMENNVGWNFRKVCPTSFDILLSADENGAGEMAVYEYYSNGRANESYPDFDDVVRARYEEFAAFFDRYPPVPEIYADMARKAAYQVWSVMLGPRGYLRSPIVYMHKLFFCRAFGWHQSFHALAMKNDPVDAWNLAFAMFDYQNEAGLVPDHVSDLREDVWVATKPPIYGYGVCQMLDEFDLSGLTRGDYAAAYDKLSRFTNWWFTHHDRAGTGFPSYYHADESGYDESTAFNAGLPVQSPDLLSYTVFNCEACARLAEKLGLADEAAQWKAAAQRVLDYLVGELWDGEQFLSRLPADGRLYKCGAVVQLQPIMLGRRLPQEIIDKLTARLMDPEEFLTDYGTATENLQSDKLVVKAFTRGAVVAPTQMLIIMGMYDAGKTAEARALSIRYLNALMHKGLALGIHPFRVEPVTFARIPEDHRPLAVGFPFAPWVGSVFLALAAKLRETGGA